MRYWRERDACSVELFEHARNMAEPDYNNPLNRLIYRRAAADPALAARLAEIHQRVRPSLDAFTAGEVSRWVLGAVLRGNLGVV